MKPKFNLRKKKGLSAVITTLLLVSLALILVGIVWAMVTNLVRTQIKSASCVDVTGKVSINNKYTCYNSTSHELQFSISMGDISVDSILVEVTSQGNSANFELPNASATVANVVMYPSMLTNVKAPNKNSGSAYLFNVTAAGLTEAPDSITVSPTLGTTQCGATDQLNQIDDCTLLA